MEAGPPAPQGLSLRERIAVAGQPEEEARLNEEPEDPPQQAEQPGRAPAQEPLGWAASPTWSPALPGTLSPEADGPVAMQPPPLDLPHPPRSTPAEHVQYAVLQHDRGAPQLPAHRQCPWPWLLDLQQTVRDWGAAVCEPAAQHAVTPGPAAAAPSAEQRACSDVAGGRPLAPRVRVHAEEVWGDRHTATAKNVIRGEQAPAAAEHGRHSPCRKGRKRRFPEAAPNSIPPQKVGRKLADQSSLEHAPAAAPSLSLAERMRLAQNGDSLQEHPETSPMHPTPQPQPLCQGVRRSGGDALASTKKISARGSPPSEMLTQPLHQLPQARHQPGPQEASVQQRQAPPKFSEDTHSAPMSQKPLLQRLRRRSRSPQAHPETESCVEPFQREAPASRSGDGVDVVASQEPLAQRLRREGRSADGDAGPGAAGRPVLKRARPVLEATIQQSRDQGSQHIAQQQFSTDSAPGEYNDWASHQDQLVHTPHLCNSAKAHAVAPDSARSGSGKDTTPELRWRRPKPSSPVLQDSSGRPLTSLGHSKHPQQPIWDDSQTDQAVQCMPPELGTPLMTHASSAGAAAPGDASTGLQWRRPLARRSQNCLNTCAPGTPSYSFCVLSC